MTCPEGKEKNQYLDTIKDSKPTVVACGDAVFNGVGSPLDAIANPISNGGWVCSKADEWVTDMTGACAGITDAFDGAVTAVQQRIGIEEAEPCVDKGDYRGDSWPQQWARRHNI